MCVPGGTLIFVPSIQGYLSDRGTLDKQEVLLGMVLYLSSIFILLFARGNLECESVHSFNGSALGLVLYAFGDF